MRLSFPRALGKVERVGGVILLQGGDGLNKLEPFYWLLKSLSCPSTITIKVLSSSVPLLSTQLFQGSMSCGCRAARRCESVTRPGRTSCVRSAR